MDDRSNCKNADSKPIIKLLRDSEVTGVSNRRKINKILPRRFYILNNIVPCEDILAHIFLGFTRDGRYILSYCFEQDSMGTNNTMYFFIWHFNHHSPLKFVSKHMILKSSNNLTPAPQIDYLYESTAIHVYQWPCDDKHLLILTIPESPQPSVINLVCIHIDQKRSHILHPGLITLSVVDWKYKLSAMYRKNEFNFTEYLSPGLLLFGPSVCTFHTGTEIVFLEIKKPEAEGEYCKVISSVLDVEQVLAETLDNKNVNNFIGLSNYEVLVFGINPKPATVYSYVQAIIREPCNKKSILEFTIAWNVDKKAYKTIECGTGIKSNEKSKAQVQSILRRLVETLKKREIYSLNNIQFLETQASFDSLNSPVDNVSVILSLA